MALTSTQPPSSDKENLFGKAFASRDKRKTNTRRHHFLVRHTGFATSRSHATREAARRIRHRAPIVPHKCTLGLALEDDGLWKEPAVDITTTAAAAQRKISLPRHLQRPAYRGIASAAISAVNPVLTDIPIEYIHQELQAVGEQMRAAAAKIAARCPKGRLPHDLEVVVNDPSADAPTHVFAVYSQPPSALHKQRITLHPVHALVLASTCANLPPLPHSQPATPDSPQSTATLPVVMLYIQSPITFPILLDYLYMRRSDHLLASLIPLPSHDLGDDAQALERLSRKLAETFTVPALMTHVFRTYGLWSNVAALGVFDEKLWRAIDVAWAVLLGALAVSTGESWSSQSP